MLLLNYALLEANLTVFQRIIVSSDVNLMSVVVKVLFKYMLKRQKFSLVAVRMDKTD